ncbi:hypothetical protein BC940DRAFT_227037, partial [Gongronella butleri]
WKLSTGKIVEEALYTFAKSLSYESAPHSFIVDPEDAQIVDGKVFSPDELHEIRSKDLKPVPEMPLRLQEYLESLNKARGSIAIRNDTLQGLRVCLHSSQPWHATLNAPGNSDLEWAHHASMFRVTLLHQGQLEVQHQEQWYDAHVWCFMDSLLQYDCRLSVARGESCSTASSARKNDRRTSADQRKLLGHRLDMVIRSRAAANHLPVFEFGCGESGKDFASYRDTKVLRENGLKLPKALKDMLDALAVESPGKLCELETMGVATYG